MPRFFIKDESSFSGNEVTLYGDEANHISHSLRMKTGDEVTLCDFFNYEYDCVIKSFSHDSVTLEILDKHPAKNEPDIKVTLFQGLPKSTKLELIIQKCVELGIFEIVPVLTSRCISRPDEKSGDKKTKRWNAISEEAAKQSGRGIIPRVCDTVSFKQAVEAMQGYDVRFMCYELCSDSDGADIKSFLREKCGKESKTVAFLIGPEGGISKEEAEYAHQNGISFVSLGRRILRTETAPLCVLSTIMYETDNLK